MAVAASALLWENAGSQMTTSGTLTFSGTYTTGGETLSAGAVGLGSITSIDFQQGEDGYIFRYVPSTGKVMIFASAASSHTHNLSIIGGQGAAGTDTVTAPAATDILGKQEAGDALVLGADVATKGGVVAASIAAAALAEIANGTSLTGVVTQFKAWGY